MKDALANSAMSPLNFVSNLFLEGTQLSKDVLKNV
jgi:hypothetical protein